MPQQRAKDMYDVFAKAQSEYQAALEETKRGQFGGEAIGNVSKALAQQDSIKKRAIMETSKQKALQRMQEKRARNNVEVTQYDAGPCMRQPDLGGTSPASKSPAESSSPQVLHLSLKGSNSAASAGDGQIFGED